MIAKKTLRFEVIVDLLNQEQVWAVSGPIL